MLKEQTGTPLPAAASSPPLFFNNNKSNLQEVELAYFPFNNLEAYFSTFRSYGEYVMEHFKSNFILIKITTSILHSGNPSLIKLRHHGEALQE